MVVVYLDEEGDCPNCGLENAYVLRDDDKVCENCNYMPRAVSHTPDDTDEWEQWWEHRRQSDEYSGFEGENRIKFVGGFVLPYIDGE